MLGVFTLPARDRRLRPLPAAPGDASRPRFSARMLITLGSSVAGLGIASYLTLAHYTSVVSLVCPNSGAINCDAVTTSSESYLLGIPVAVLGLVYFVVVLVFARRPLPPPKSLRGGRASLTVNRRPCKVCPFRPAMARSRSSPSASSMNPKPRDCPVVLSRMTTAEAA